MKILITLLALVVMQGCTLLPGDTYVELGAGKNYSFSHDSDSENKWQSGGGVAAYISARQEYQVSPRVTGFAQFTHISQWDQGWPVNDHAESTVDHFGVGLKFRISQ